jgi:hypothetical protein
MKLRRRANELLARWWIWEKKRIDKIDGLYRGNIVLMVSIFLPRLSPQPTSVSPFLGLLLIQQAKFGL